jgi:hypothetical protein
MNTSVVIVEGIVKEDGTLEVAERVSLPPGRVQLMVVSLPDLPKDDPFWQRMQAIWSAQKTRGHIARSVQEVEAERQAVREEWEKRMQHIEQIQAEAEQARKSMGQAK